MNTIHPSEIIMQASRWWLKVMVFGCGAGAPMRVWDFYSSRSPRCPNSTLWMCVCVSNCGNYYYRTFSICHLWIMCYCLLSLRLLRLRFRPSECIRNVHESISIQISITYTFVYRYDSIWKTERKQRHVPIIYHILFPFISTELSLLPIPLVYTIHLPFLLSSCICCFAQHAMIILLVSHSVTVSPHRSIGTATTAGRQQHCRWRYRKLYFAADTEIHRDARHN